MVPFLLKFICMQNRKNQNKDRVAKQFFSTTFSFFLYWISLFVCLFRKPENYLEARASLSLLLKRPFMANFHVVRSSWFTSCMLPALFNCVLESTKGFMFKFCIQVIVSALLQHQGSIFQNGFFGGVQFKFSCNLTIFTNF